MVAAPPGSIQEGVKLDGFSIGYWRNASLHKRDDLLQEWCIARLDLSK